MSGPNPPGYGPADRPVGDDREELTDTGFSRAYSAPESEQYSIAPYLPADVETYDYDSYDHTYGRGELVPVETVDDLPAAVSQDLRVAIRCRPNGDAGFDTQHAAAATERDGSSAGR